MVIFKLCIYLKKLGIWSKYFFLLKKRKMSGTNCNLHVQKSNPKKSFFYKGNSKKVKEIKKNKELLALNFVRVFQQSPLPEEKFAVKKTLRNIHLAKTGKIFKSFFCQNFKQVVQIQIAIYMSKITVRGNLFLEEKFKKGNWVLKNSIFLPTISSGLSKHL